jgi:hypothetical protein
LKSLSGAFVILVTGCILSGLAFIIERSIGCTKKNYNTVGATQYQLTYSNSIANSINIVIEKQVKIIKIIETTIHHSDTSHEPKDDDSDLVDNIQL